MDIKKSNWWISPYWIIDTGFDNQFNAELEEELYWIAKDISTGNDNDPKNSLWEYDRPHLNTLKNYIHSAVKKHVFSLISEAKELNIEPDYVMAWANIKEPGESIEAHAHNDASLTATYYIRAKENSGDLVLLSTQNIVDSRGAFTHNDKSQLEHIHIQPKEGSLVFFPAYVVHEIQENKSNDLRISLSTDIQQKIDKHAPNAMILKSWTNSFLKIKE
jgi:uncharacterized protein (TIGR02466 family)